MGDTFHLGFLGSSIRLETSFVQSIFLRCLPALFIMGFSVFMEIYGKWSVFGTLSALANGHKWDSISWMILVPLVLALASFLALIFELATKALGSKVDRTGESE